MSVGIGALDERGASEARLGERGAIVETKSFDLSGVVVDSVTEAPVSAVLRCSGGDGSWITTQSDSGRFSLPCASGESVQVRAAGYRASRIEVGGRRELTVRLAAESSAELCLTTVHGEPISGVPVQWNSASSPLRVRWGKELTSLRCVQRGEPVRVITDDSGVSSVTAGGGMAATIDSEEHGCLPILRVDAGERRAFVLPSRTTRVLLVDLESRAPLEGLDLVCYWPAISRSLARVLRVGASGQILISELGDAVIVGLPEGRDDLELIALGGQGVYQEAPDSSSVRIEFLDRGEPVVLGARRFEGVIRLRDASTHLPVTATVRATFRTDGDRVLPDGSRAAQSVAYSSRDSLAPATEKLSVLGGELVLGRKLRGEWRIALDSSEHMELVLVAEGYAPAVISLAGVHELSALDGRTVMLEPATPRWLKVVTTDRAPFSEPATIFDPECQLQLLRRSSSESGLYGPFDWTQGDAIARVGGYEWTLTSDELVSTDVVERVVPMASGNIRVIGVPTPECASRLLAKRGSALGEGESRVTFAADGACIFKNLSPGRYVVGPEEWVFGAALHSIQLPSELGTIAEVRAHRSRCLPGRRPP